MIALVCATILVMLGLSMKVYQQQKQLLVVVRNNDSLSTILQELQHKHAAVINADLVINRMLIEINRQLLTMDSQVQALETQRANDGAFQHALRILEMGGDKAEIMHSCHLAHAEAELLMNLYSYRQAIKSV